MKRLGISIYPDRSEHDEVLAYLERAADAGFSRIFSCLLTMKGGPDKVRRDYTQINARAHELGFEVVLDCNPAIFNELGVTYKDLSFFKEIGADGVRLDMGFTGLEESIMSFNPEGLSIELNMSNNVHYLDTVMDYQPDPNRLVGCHNFYPHDNTGLTLEHFERCTARFRRYGLQTAAFVTSQADNTFANWPVTCGLPTLEMHRKMPLHLQVEHYIALGGIDDVIISNCYPTDEELACLKDLPKNMVSFGIELVDQIPDVERSIVLDELHFNRGDVCASALRSTQSRVKYKGHNFELFNAPKQIMPGDVIIESSEFGHYAGELQVAKMPMENSGMSNVVGHIPEEELFLLDYIRPWQKFRFHKA